MDTNETMSVDILAEENFTTTGDECTNQLPTVQEYLDGLTLPIAIIIAATVLLSIGTFSIFFKNAYHILHRTPKQFKTKSILLLTIYPLITLFGVVSVAVPRAFFLCDTVMHVYFMICAYVFFSLCMQYVDGEDALIKSTDSQTFSLRTPPLCCFVPLFKRAPVTKNRLRFVRMLIMQLPVVQTALFLALNVVFVEDYPNFNRIILYFVPMIVISILLGVWGLNILVRMLAPLYSDLKLMGKYFVLQAVLILCRIQPLIIAAIVSSGISDCAFPNTLQVQKNAIFQLCLCFEMMVLSCWASLLYKSPSIIGPG
ncbi:organic solute transporter alpha-like protein [Anopheles merus]|uniref:Organic solute transporter alpha-like protein n=1 Tax=Anopheles merus TaxID=30066 RepID=A0A182V928_ANOME|nr:organic solute transporter alpha-like protein [Anopheles merus]XP_041762183.1 organic solute transporter alpha-like protein [Anopheles merus]XP_041762184.1 organic solute transporter alpha-like protein [Anopheles merus]